YHNGKEPPYTPITMVDRNGSVLCETDQFDLLGAIIYRDDVTTLEQYLDIAPWVIEEIEELPLYYSFFYIAVSHGSLGALKTLLSYYVRVIEPNQIITFRKRGFTLLNEAARRAYLEIVEFLLDNQPLYADIHERDYTGCTAIAADSDLYSTRYTEAFNWQPSVDKSEAVMNLLLDWGAFPSDVVARAHEDSSGKPETVLLMASELAGSKMIERLVSGGADVHAEFTKHSLQLRLYDEQDYIVDNVTAIHMASFRGNFVALETLLDHHGDTVSALEMSMSKILRGTRPCITPLDISVKMGKSSGQIFKALCDKGADSSIHNNHGETPLHSMFSSDGTDETIDKQILSLLLAHGAKVNDIDHAGNTPLHITARRLDYHNIMSFLIEQGGDATIGNSTNETPVHVAASGDVSTPGLAEKVEIQNAVLTTLTNAGGIELMDLPNAEGKTPKQICKAQRDKWRGDENRERMINGRRERILASTASCSSISPVNVERCHN
ncbi:ankyrin repeat-containing domain protein, partial [Fusarium oxysporum]